MALVNALRVIWVSARRKRRQAGTVRSLRTSGRVDAVRRKDLLIVVNNALPHIRLVHQNLHSIPVLFHLLIYFALFTVLCAQLSSHKDRLSDEPM